VQQPLQTAPAIARQVPIISADKFPIGKVRFARAPPQEAGLARALHKDKEGHMFDSLLVPLDQSEFSEHALPTAIALAGESGAALHLVHVHVPNVGDHMISNTQFQWEGLDLDELDRRHKVQEGKYLEETARRTSGPLPGRTSTTLLDGPVPEAIQRFADQSEVDLIVTTRHGKRNVSRFWRGDGRRT
jgi:nucleotide-binding universal stress UspA family protein